MKNSVRKYNRLIADETIEDYSLRYTPKSFRKFPELLIANTAIGSISFLALEAIGAGIGLHYGFSTAFWAILTASLIIFITAIPISYYAAKHNIDIDLITRSAGFGYVGSTFTSLIYASFSFIFFALEAAIMAQAIYLYFALPLYLGYLLSSIIIIPLVFYGITLINRLQLYTQPIWLIMMIAPFIAVLLKEPLAISSFFSLKGSISNSSDFNFYYFGFAVGISLSLIAQIGEQVDYLRFMPSLTKKNRVKWWISMILAGPGWIILGFLKQIGGMFLASIVIISGYSITDAKTPIEMYNTAYTYIFSNPQTALAVATVFVVISQIKINVTNAYAGSLAWSNFFSRITHSHPGRVVWMIFNISIALLLMESGIFNVLEKILGLYSNVAIAWIGAIFADLVINKPLGLSPKIAEFKRAYLYNINPVGVVSMGVASFISILSFMGFFGEYAQSYSSILAMFISIFLSPIIAYVTKGKYYIARENSLNLRKETHYVCQTCNHTYEKEDMAFCPLYSSHICSLCCSLDSLCHDMCKFKHEKSLRDKIGSNISSIFAGKISNTTALKIFDFLSINLFLVFIIGIIVWMTLDIYIKDIPVTLHVMFKDIIFHYSLAIVILTSIISWWILLLQDSRQRAEALLEDQNRELEAEVEIRKKAEQKAENEAKAKADFLANMSHEIRTPMNSIIGINKIVLKTDLNEAQRDNLQKIEISAKSLLSIINNILDFSKMEAQKLHLDISDFDMLKLLQDTIDIFEIALKEKNLRLNLLFTDNISRNFRGDSLRLKQILTNLLSNAIKFTDEGEITIKIEKVSKNRFRFKVDDTGIGLNEQEQKKLFKSFSQADGSTTRKYGGTGLGLSISKELVQLMGGNIHIESKKEIGSSFIFEINLLEIDDNKFLKASEIDNINADILSSTKESKKEEKQTDKSKMLTKQRKDILKMQLIEALKTKRPKRCEPIVQKIKNYTLTQEDETYFNRVLIFIKKYKFKEAMEILNDW